MLSLAMLLSVVPAAPALSAVHAELEEATVRWGKKDYTVDALPAELGPGPAAAVGVWADWVLAHDYRMDLDPEGRVLLISSKKNGKLKRQLQLVASTSKRFDELFPAPPRLPQTAAGGDEAPRSWQEGGDEIPEDPGGLPGFGGEDSGPAVQSHSYEWGAGTWPVDTETCILFVARDEDDYADILDRLGELQEYLRPWLATAKRFTGFVLESPLVGAYIENAAGMEEWDPDNEVVNRVTQLLFVRRFSQQPYWLVLGVAWQLEFELRKGIYCYPYRDEFVWATEHTGWSSVLRDRFKDRKSEPLRTEEFSHWRRGSYDDAHAKLSFGLVDFLVRFYPDRLTGFAEELRLFRDRDNRVELGNGSWARKPDYELPDAELTRLLEVHFGPLVLTDASEFFRKGKSFRLPKKR
jgi:hypothetical protein